MNNLWASVLVGVVAALISGWWSDRTRVRAAAAAIDARFKSLRRPPRYTPLGDAADIPLAVLERLDQFDAVCMTSLGFTAQGRLREYSGEGVLMGVRTVLLNADRTIAAAFATSHQNPALAFRAFTSELPAVIVYASDASTISPPTPHIEPLRYHKRDDASVLLAALRKRLASLGIAPVPFDSMAAYIAMQDRSWQIHYEARLQNANVIDLDTLRRLSNSKLSERRLRRVHAEILKLHRG